MSQRTLRATQVVPHRSDRGPFAAGQETLRHRIGAGRHHRRVLGQRGGRAVAGIQLIVGVGRGVSSKRDRARDA